MRTEQTGESELDKEIYHHLRIGMRMVGALWEKDKMSKLTEEMREQTFALLDKHPDLLEDFIIGAISEYRRKGINAR